MLPPKTSIIRDNVLNLRRETYSSTCPHFLIRPIVQLHPSTSRLSHQNVRAISFPGVPVGAAHQECEFCAERRPIEKSFEAQTSAQSLTSFPSQQARRYASQPPSSSGSKSVFLFFLGGVAGGYWYSTQKSGAAQKAEAKVKEVLPAGAGGAKKALTGGDQGFVSLKLEDVENVNHNTKKFRFKLPEDDMVSGLEVASAILTKFKPEGEGNKPVLRPYTPVSDEGTCSTLCLRALW